MSKEKHIGVIGLGSMGHGIAVSLLKSTQHVFGFDINTSAVDSFISNGGRKGEFDIVSELDIVFIVVVNSEQTENVLFGQNGIAPTMKKNAVVISCATVSPEFAQEMETRCKEFDILYLDAPISGGSKKAEQGKLSIMASGSVEAFDTSQTALDAIADKVFKLGDKAGPGSAMKVINQLLAGVHIAAAAEAIMFGVAQGVDAKKTVEVISQCAGTSWMFENRGPHIAEGDYTPHSAVNIFIKDLGIVGDIAKASRFSTPLASAALQQFISASGMGYGHEDDSAVAKVYAHTAQLKLPGEEK